LWVQSGYSIRDDYRSLLAQVSGIEETRVDFRTDAASACIRINEWAQTHTGGKITRVISPALVHPKTKLVLSVCLYVRASWRKPFWEGGTRNEQFRIGPNESVAVPMMHEHSYVKDFNYWTDDLLQMLEVTSAGGECSFIVLLPRTWNGLDALEESMTLDRLESCIKEKYAPEEMDVKLPRFAVTARLSLKDALAGLGVRRAFEPSADFSGINGKQNDLFVWDVLHAATVDVNERGIEAAAAVDFVTPDAFGDEPVSFHADQPFVFLVRDNRTGCILILGRLANPT
jgi:serpin B